MSKGPLTLSPLRGEFKHPFEVSLNSHATTNQTEAPMTMAGEPEPSNEAHIGCLP